MTETNLNFSRTGNRPDAAARQRTNGADNMATSLIPPDSDGNYRGRQDTNAGARENPDFGRRENAGAREKGEESKPAAPSDEELASRARVGDKEAFELLVRRYERKILALTRRMCGNPEDGAEAAQEAFISAWLGLPDFRGDSSFSTWLYKLACHACVDQMRRQKRHNSHAGPSLDDYDAAFDPPDPSPSPQALAEQSDLRHEIEVALQDLSPEHREILILREMHQLSYHEIGRVLSLEAGTVKSRVSRARSALRKIMMGNGSFDGNFSSAVSSIKTGEEGKA